MPMDPVSAWVDAIAGLKPDGGKSGDWAKALADVVDQRVTSKAGVAGVMGSVSFTFQKALFETGLKKASPTSVTLHGAMAIADAWEMAATASTIVVPPGASLGVASPATTWSVVISSIILPPSVALGKLALMQTLASAAPVPDAKASLLGPALYQAFAALLVSISGINSLAPPAGPTPLPLPSAPII
ncbi:hypothetical protein UFOVP244_174 [uncultured Caudovirales phage]|uniref:Uncharacterized protein n=1 Tax=uncultured Caudovirales phage TaxID=2100421 RepID=A0A6J7WU27_9CAUD|nr:hypothetical protein UFOVP244_174 [uncultured Caudovirales phage]